MKSRSWLLTMFSVFALLAYNNCGKSGFVIDAPASIIASGTSAPLNIVGNESNVMKVTMGCGYINEPCVSVTLCEPGTNTCQTINNILLDTGSYGLRVFGSVVSVNLPQKTVNGANLAQCVGFADGSSSWGPIKNADVVLGGLRSSTIPIQIVDATYPTIPVDCTDPDTSPAAVGFNGILGVGAFIEDCGVGCANRADNGVYYRCSSGTCTGTAVPIAQQIPNPVAYLPSDNNGVVLQFPSIPSSGSATASGYMALGIGTRPNNTPKNANIFPGDGNGYIRTVFNGTTYTSFIDSGSNGLFFPATTSLLACSASTNVSGFFCPAAPVALSATQTTQNGTPRVLVSFEIMSAAVAATPNNPNSSFNNIGGNFPNIFDWGMPFYFGRTVFHGIDGRGSVLGTGPLVAW